MKKQIDIREKLSCLLLVLGMVFSFQACSEEEPGEGILPPALATQSALNIARTSVTVRGEIDGNMNMVKECGVKYSTSRLFPDDRTERVVLPEIPSGKYVELDITGLNPNEQYYYCWYATTGVTEVCSNTGEFTTAATQKPTFSAFICDSIGEDFAIFSCQIQEIGDNFLMEYGVSYKQPSEKTFIPVTAEKIDESTMKYSVEIRELKAMTEYSVRAYAKNSSDETGNSGMMEGYSDVISIKTQNQLSPQVSTYDVTTIGITSFTVTGVVSAAIGSDGVITECGFCWSENDTPSIADNAHAVDNKELKKDFSYVVTGLLPQTTYYVCAYAKNTVDGQERVGYGEIRQVTTADLIIPQLEITKMDSGTGSFTVTANIQNYDEAALVEKGFIWSENDYNVTYQDAVKKGNVFKVEDGSKIFKGMITGLKMETHYYVKAYAIYEGSGVQEIGYSETWGNGTWGLNFYDVDVESTTDDAYEVTSGVRGAEDLTYLEVVEKGFCWLAAEEWTDVTLDEGKHTGYVVVTDGTLESFSTIITDLEFATHYYIRPYVKVKEGNETVVMYGGMGIHESKGFDIGYPIAGRTKNSFDITMSIDNLSSIPADVVIEEVGVYWEEWNEEGNRTPLEQLPAENKLIGTLDENGQLHGTAAGLKEGTKYWVSVYIKFNGKIIRREWWEDTTATIPSIEDNQSPEKQ